MKRLDILAEASENYPEILEKFHDRKGLSPDDALRAIKIAERIAFDAGRKLEFCLQNISEIPYDDYETWDHLKELDSPLLNKIRKFYWEEGYDQWIKSNQH